MNTQWYSINDRNGLVTQPVNLHKITVVKVSAVEHTWKYFDSSQNIIEECELRQ